MSRNTGARALAVVTAILGGIVVIFGSAASASATLGSVPREVSAYLQDGLVAQLTDLYGTDGSGAGIDFDESTEAAAVTRVFAFTDEYLAGVETETPVRRLNEWVAVVSVGEEVVGVATVIIPVGRELPELSLFAPEPELAAALPELSDAAALVRDDERAAWYSLEDSELTAVHSGESGLVGTVSLAGFIEALLYPATATPGDEGGEPGVLIGALTLVAGLSIVVILLVLARRRPELEPGS